MKTKTRLTITLSKNILTKVDSLIDGYSIRNRSHSIENLLKKSLNSSITTAVMLAGGSRKNNKILSLKKINNKFALSIVISQLKKFGITRLIICAGKNETKIKNFFGNGSIYGIDIIYSSEKKLLGSAGAIKNAQEIIGYEPFLVINDNILTDLNLRDLFDFHFREGSIATICVKPRMSEEKYGQAFLHGNKIIKFLDKSEKKGISIINIGLYVLTPKIFELIKPNKYLNLETDIFPKLAENKELSAFVFQGSWFDISEESLYKKVIKNWRD